ncbi:MAG: hypothetical protein R8P61_22555 [Bacteroidia bacterium]|nr:hypothetical protein [Bacteroidia bacterium]
MKKDNGNIVEKIIVESLFELMRFLPKKKQIFSEQELGLPKIEKIELLKQIDLFGKFGVLDSLGLVNLIVIIDRKVKKEFAPTFSLTSKATFKRAINQETSPFLRIELLKIFVCDLIEEDF